MSLDVDPALLERAREHQSAGDLDAAITELAAATRARPEAGHELELVRLRHQACLGLRHEALVPQPPAIAEALAVDAAVGLPVTEAPVSAAVVRKTIETHGSVIVRGFLNRERTSRMRETVRSALSARDQVKSGGVSSAWYSEFPGADGVSRWFTSQAGMLAADSPRGLCRLLDMFSEVGVDRLATEFLGGRPVFSVEKSVFRSVLPGPQASWHQDGAFLGEHIRSLDVWIALSPCGRNSPGLEIVSRRIDRVLPTGEYFTWDLSERVIAENYPGFRKVTPEFEPGDAILFDQLCVHRTANAPTMTERRLAIECWLFAAGNVPPKYAGLVL